MTDKELEQKDLKIVCPDAYEMAKFDKDAFIKLRRTGLGASDSSIVLGVNPFSDQSSLVTQKLATEVTEDERAVGEKESVRKGADLEPLILNKFEQWSGFETYKPDAMYQLNKHPQLTVNFDGIICLNNTYIPVEAKYVSQYANKYWDRSKAIENPGSGLLHLCGGVSIEEHIKQEAELYGVPVYYYTQVQQQLLALDAPFGYLVALFDKGWELGVYKIFADPITQQTLIVRSKELWNTVEAKRGSN